MRVISLLLLALVSGSLQGCFPVIAVGVGAGVMMAQDRRSKDAFIEDQQIETNAFERIEKQFNSVMHVNVTSYNRNVLISGEVLDESARN
jgi:osmotically-inducible protein OsmY